MVKEGSGRMSVTDIQVSSTVGSVLDGWDGSQMSYSLRCSKQMARDYSTSVCSRLESAVVFSEKSAFKLKGKEARVCEQLYVR